MAKPRKTTAQHVEELHREALAMFPRLERIIDELKGLEPREELNALPNIECWLGQLSGRAHVQGSPYRYGLLTAREINPHTALDVDHCPDCGGNITNDGDHHCPMFEH